MTSALQWACRSGLLVRSGRWLVFVRRCSEDAAVQVRSVPHNLTCVLARCRAICCTCTPPMLFSFRVYFSCVFGTPPLHLLHADSVRASRMGSRARRPHGFLCVLPTHFSGHTSHTYPLRSSHMFPYTLSYAKYRARLPCGARAEIRVCLRLRPVSVLVP